MYIFANKRDENIGILDNKDNNKYNENNNNNKFKVPLNSQNSKSKMIGINNL